MRRNFVKQNEVSWCTIMLAIIIQSQQMKEVTLQNYNKDKYYSKVVNAVEKLLRNGSEIRAIDVFVEVGILE